ncbi:polyprenyl synthetase family protein [Candidatus Gracilibacteria bacterium]|nr:polyprenyl synthetase family protein [Candidatus Gracilibacteria bacterium]
MLHEWYDTYKSNVDEAIKEYFTKRYTSLGSPEEERFEEAVRYAVMTPGKRLRPILAMMAYEELMGLPGDVVLPYLVGLEMIHAYSLVHDDLPSMDNDELRRGQPTVWKRYDEPTAILVGDALQIMGIECLAASNHVKVITEVSKAIGDMGMVRGQIRDVMTDATSLNQKEMIRLHDEKTGRLISSSLVIGAILAGVEEGQVFDQIRWFGVLLGRAFQVRDDILDHEGRAENTGKAVGKDITQKKGIVSYMGIEKTKKLLQELEYGLIDITNNFQTSKFGDIVEYVVRREK